VQELPADVEKFLVGHVRSLAHLEVLFFLHQRPNQDLTAEVISRELRTNKNYALTQLDELSAFSLIKKVAEQTFVYVPDEQLDALLEKTALVYKKQRVTIIGLFYNQPSERIRSFSDAFRFKKDGGK
jgi:hypothetical protein